MELDELFKQIMLGIVRVALGVGIVIQQLHYLKNEFVDLWVCSINVGTLRGISGETVEEI